MRISEALSFAIEDSDGRAMGTSGAEKGDDFPQEEQTKALIKLETQLINFLEGGLTTKEFKKRMMR